MGQEPPKGSVWRLAWLWVAWTGLSALSMVWVLVAIGLLSTSSGGDAFPRIVGVLLYMTIHVAPYLVVAGVLAAPLLLGWVAMARRFASIDSHLPLLVAVLGVLAVVLTAWVGVAGPRTPRTVRTTAAGWAILWASLLLPRLLVRRLRPGAFAR